MTKAGGAIKGLSLLEMLLAGSIFAIILSVLAGFLINSNKIYSENAQQTEKEQLVGVAEQVLTYELSLAGYRGTDISKLATRVFDASKKSFEVSTGDPSDKLTVRYFEDRYTNGSGAVAKAATYFAAANEQGESYLYRQESGSTAAPIVEAVTALKVLAYVQTDGTQSSSLPADETLAGVQLKLSFDHGYDHTMIVNFSGPQGYE